MEYFKRISRAFLVVTAIVLSGCVYNQIKTAVDAQPESWDPVIQAAKDADKKLQDAQYLEVEDRLAEDNGECPLAGPDMGPLALQPLYVRDPRDTLANHVFEKLYNLNDKTTAGTDPGCATLFYCEKNPGAEGCRSVCYTEPEMECIVKIKIGVMKKAADVKRQKDGKPIDGSSEDTDVSLLESRLAQIELAPRTSPANLHLMYIAKGLETYLTELTKVADKKVSDVAPIHDHFLEYESQFWVAYKSIDATPPEAATSYQTKLTDTGNAIDGLINSVATIIDEQKRSASIEAIITKNDPMFDLALNDAHKQLDAMDQDLRAHDDLRWSVAKKEFKAQFEAIANPQRPQEPKKPSAKASANEKENYSQALKNYNQALKNYSLALIEAENKRNAIRKSYLDSQRAYELNDEALVQLVPAYQKMFKNLDSSRKSLHELITNPTTAQTLTSVKDGLANAAGVATKILGLYKSIK